MRYISVALVLLAMILANLGMTRASAENAQGEDKAKTQGRQTGSSSSGDDEPLLLLGGPEDDVNEKAGADNSRCHVCHLNFAMEKIAVIHAKEEIGCSDCHGDCDDHIADESWASGGPGTAPDIMYPRESIDPACGKCHSTHDAPPRAVLERWRERCSNIEDVSNVVCTDCHGRHRVNPKLRKARWNKKTGEPIAEGETSTGREG
ncbi:MAG: hypothetical protein ACQESR_13230 [Planctomycetota bacterium]